MVKLITLCVLATAAGIAQAQSVDLLNDAYRTPYSFGIKLVPPISFGTIDFPNQVLLTSSIFFSPYTNQGSNTNYDSNIWYSFSDDSSDYNARIKSQVCWNFGPTSYNLDGRTIPAQTVAMYSEDHIPVFEGVVEKGTYDFQASASPIGGPITKGNFQFQTLTAGTWTVQFTLKMNQPRQDARTLTFASKTRVRWLLIRNTDQVAQAAVSIRYQEK